MTRRDPAALRALALAIDSSFAACARRFSAATGSNKLLCVCEFPTNDARARCSCSCGLVEEEDDGCARKAYNGTIGLSGCCDPPQLFDSADSLTCSALMTVGCRSVCFASTTIVRPLSVVMVL
jgi:hypothetical protein